MGTIPSLSNLCALSWVTALYIIFSYHNKQKQKKPPSNWHNIQQQSLSLVSAGAAAFAVVTGNLTRALDFSTWLENSPRLSLPIGRQPECQADWETVTVAVTLPPRLAAFKLGSWQSLRSAARVIWTLGHGVPTQNPAGQDHSCPVGPRRHAGSLRPGHAALAAAACTSSCSSLKSELSNAIRAPSRS